MGAGILPTTMHNNKLYFLFGKENKYEDSAPGFSDFGGGTDNKETLFKTAIREATEELTGFLGNQNDIYKLLTKYGTYNIDYDSNTHSIYRMHIFPYKYNPWLPYFFNNNQQFIQHNLNKSIIKKSKIFEKSEIKWVCIDEIHKMRSQFRPYFRNIIDMILIQKKDILQFIKKNIKNKTLKSKFNKNKTLKH